MNEREFCEILLNLKPPWVVRNVILNEGKHTLDIYVDHPKGIKFPCPECNVKSIVYDHQDERIWRDKDSVNFETYLHAKPPRIRCSEHGVLVANIPWSEKSSRFTIGFETHAIDVLQSTDVTKASAILGISWDEAWHIMDKAVDRGLARKTSNPEVIGIDEKSYGKHHNYVTIVYNLIKPGVEYVSFGRKKSSINRYYTTLDREKRKKIRSVSMDMWKPYIMSTKRYVKDADSKIVFDRFHISKHMNQALDDVRKHENTILRKSGDGTLAGTKYVWLYTEKNLPKKYRKIFNELKNSDLKTARAYSIKENLRNLWNCTTVEEAKEFWKRWYFWATHSRLDPIIKKAKMIRDHLSGVMAYFTHRITNAVAEGMNSKIATIQKMAYGYRNKEHFKTAIYFHCGNLQLYSVIH